MKFRPLSPESMVGVGGGRAYQKTLEASLAFSTAGDDDR